MAPDNLSREQIADLQSRRLSEGANDRWLDERSRARLAQPSFGLRAEVVSPSITSLVIKDRVVDVAADRVVLPSEQVAAARKALGDVFDLAEDLGGGVSRLLVRGDKVDLASVLAALQAADLEPSADLVIPNAMGKKGSSLGMTPERRPADVKRTVPELGPASRRAVRVAVIDTGVYFEASGPWNGLLHDVDQTGSNVDLRNVINLSDGSHYLDDAAGHGTFVTGIVRQMVPGQEIVVYKALNSDGVGTVSGVAAAITRAAKDFDVTHSGVDARLLIHCSLGTDTADGVAPKALARAIEALHPLRHKVVASSGNGGNHDPVWPAAFPEVVAVGSTRLGQPTAPSAFTTRGAWLNFSVCGEAVVSTYIPGEENPALDNPHEIWGGDLWATWSGTSFAAPQVTGWLAHFLHQGDVEFADAVARLQSQGSLKPDLGYCL